MDSIGYSELLTRFNKVELKDLKFITDLTLIEGLFLEESADPENLDEFLYDPNDFYIEPKTESKKKIATQIKQKQMILIGKKEEDLKQNAVQQKKKVYKPGPFAMFYEINEGDLNKDQETWYYKENKDIIGPVSSYNMDKMVFYKKINEDTRVAFKGVDKFVKFGKILKIISQEKKE